MQIGIDAEKDTLQSLIRSCLLELNKLKYDLTELEVERANDNTPLRIKELEKGEVNSGNYRDTMKKEEVFITDCSIDTDLELLIPDTYIPQISEKIRLYKELDAITNEGQLDKFIEGFVDRFGQLPEQLLQLTYVVRLRWIAIQLGFERIVIKNGIMLAYFVNNQQSPY